jgi:hypothetical protein
MLAWPGFERQYIEWIFCDGRMVVFHAGGYGSFTAAKILAAEDPHPKNQGGEYINVHNCVEFPMPGA